MTLRQLRGTSASRSTTSWGRTLAMIVLALLVSAAPRAAELCDATCTRTHEQAPASASSTASTTRSAAASVASTAAPAHCAGHATSGHMPFSHQAATAHACSMHTHLPASAAQLAATPVAAGQTRLSAPQPLQTALLPLASISPITPSSLISALLEHPAARASRSRPLTLALRI
jgi:hypothetical protein